MLLVILGAGASYDSTPNHTLSSHPTANYPWRPPLADQLFARPAFEQVLAQYKQAMAVVPRLTRLPANRTIEQVMDELQEEAKTHPMRLSQLAAIRFYLAELLSQCTQMWLSQTGHITNYYGLLDQLQTYRERTKQPVCIVSFNYDLMLEDALPTIGIDTNSLGGYIANREWSIIKPHGSTNWLRIITSTEVMDRDTVIARAAEGFDVTQEYVLNAPGLVGGRSFYPAIALPIESGKDFECPPDHLERMRECLRATHEVLIIGWRATEQPFLALMRDALPMHGSYNLAIVCGDESSASITQQNLLGAGVGSSHTQLYKDGFSDLIVRGDLNKGLIS